jgi:hypothetical protein
MMSRRDIIIYQHMKWCWNWTMLNLCGFVVAILKMVIGRNFSMSGHHYLPTYQINMGRLWCPEFIPDIEKFLAVAIFKMSTKIQHCPISSKFDMWVDNDVPTCWICAVLWLPFWKWRPVENVQCRDIIIYPHIKFWWYRTMLNFCGHFENGDR